MAAAYHIVILGADNPVGRALTALVREKQHALHAIYSTDWDLTQLEKVQHRLTELSPNIVINCIRPFGSGTTPHIASVLAQACRGLDIPLVQLSSNAVFAGQEPQLFKEDDEAFPGTAIGQQVLAVENAIVSSCPQHMILRVGWLFSSEGHDDVSKLLELARSEEILYLSDAKTMYPTSACDIALVLMAMVNQCRYAPLWGTYHYASAEKTTLFKFAEVVAAEARQYEDLPLQQIVADASHDMNAQFSEASPRLNTKKILYTFGIKPKPWRQALSRILKTRYNKRK
ncbi:SDR family oxidoreductase [Bermanella sp. R86510]|uniref:SDR family oxidoreductase n=1 Tax=unclassified Bermanella TaxID=2627862 RepID=UPI0037C8CE0E